MVSGKKHGCGRVIAYVLLLTAFGISLPSRAPCEERNRVAVLPFAIHASTPVGPPGMDLQEIFSSMIAAEGIPVIPPEEVRKDARSSEEKTDLREIGDRLGARWVVSGELTKVGRKISLGLRLLDVTDRRRAEAVFTFEDDVERLESLTEKAIAGLRDQIAGEVRIGSIRVKGNRRIETAAIMAMVRTKEGERFDQERLDQDLRAIYGLGFFREVNIQTEGPAGRKEVVFEVLEKPSIGKILYRGNRHVKDDDLKQEVGIRLFTIVDPNELQQGINRLRELYRKKGYFNVEIKERLEDLPENQVALVYEINEGEKIYIRKIRFSGNENFSDGELKGLMNTREKGFFWWVTNSGVLDEKQLSTDIEKITSFYHDHGYVKASMSQPGIHYEPHMGLTVTITLSEGPRYKVESVNVAAGEEGGSIEDGGRLLEMTQVAAEQYFNREAVRKGAEVLIDFYRDKGYAYADVTPKIHQDNDNHLVDITYSITKGEKVRIGRITITGNVSTRDKVIRRELRLNEGDYFSSSAVKKSLENLYRLGYFEDVQIKTGKAKSGDTGEEPSSLTEKEKHSLLQKGEKSKNRENSGVFVW